MQFLDDPARLAQAAADLLRADLLYLDTEFDSGRDGVRLSLIQISRGAEIYLIDALRLSDLSPLVPVLSRPEVTWVLHAGQQDIALLSSRLSIPRPARIFDTQIAWGLVTIEHSTSLAYLKYLLLGIRGEKAHQTDDWMRRPLPQAQLAYAADDVAHLPRIYEILLERAEALGRGQAIQEASAEILSGAAEPTALLEINDFRNAWQLEREGQAVLKFLIDWYNALSTADRATAPDLKGLLSIASRRPKNLDELGGLKAVPRRTINAHGRTLVSGIQRAVAQAHNHDFVLIEPRPYLTAAELLAQGYIEAIRAELCVELKIAPEIALPARLTRKMRELAIRAGELSAAAACLSGYRATLVSDAFLERAGRYPRLPAGANPE